MKASETNAASTRSCKCLNCEIGAFCRNHFYRGKLLTERDFVDEQRYFSDKNRLHNLALHGWGILCGLHVEPHARCPDLRFVVTPGYALDCCGRDLRVLKQIELPLPQPPPPPANASPCPNPQSNRKVPPQSPEKSSGSYEDEEEEDAEEQHGEGSPEFNDPCDHTPMPADLYVSICYTECETEFAPAPFDDCNCNANGDQPNRICEGFHVEVQWEKPGFWDDNCGCGCDDNCEEIFEKAEKHCPSPCKQACLPLAILRDYVPGQKLTQEQIDHSPRRHMASTATLEHVVRCILNKLPTKDTTRIVDLNWEHGERYLCHTFLNQFVGNDENHKGFEIRFDSNVASRAIDTRSFQALIVYRPPSFDEPRRMEIAPARIELDPDHTNWCRLRIDANYARRHLDGKNFDLFLTLRCNVIPGKNGLAIDGNFLATQEPDDEYRMYLPSGDNVVGGTFESWIRVRPRGKNEQEASETRRTR